MYKRVAYLGIYLSLALLLSYVETLIPINFGIYGMKLGLPNLVILTMLYTCNKKETFCVLFLRVLIIGMLFGNMFSFLYSLAGGILSMLAMIFSKKFLNLHMVNVSIIGGISHNLGQLLIAVAFIGTGKILYYFPVLFISGAITGSMIGSLSCVLLKRVKEL